MYARKLTASARERLREQRKETQLINAKAKQRSFEYVVNPPEIPKVVFGSGLERVTLPQSGPCLTSFMRKIQGEIRDYPGPHEYEVAKTMDKNFPSKLGMSVFVSKIPRLPATQISQFPPIGAYDVAVRRPFKKSAKPFGCGAPRGEVIYFLTPGPSTYSYHVPRAKPRICSVFGSARIIWPEVAVFCTPNNIAKCSKCGQTPFGDYWHNFSLSIDMCRPCMKKEQYAIKHCKLDVFVRNRVRRELDRFTHARHCGFFHDHHGTTAAIQIISKQTLRKKIKTENYLYMYMPDF